MIPDIFRLYDCVIVESFGVGGIPQRLMDAFAEGLGDYDKTHKVLILTTQVTYEGSDVASTRWASGSRTASASLRPTT